MAMAEMLLDWNDLKARGIKLSRTTIYRHMAAGTFPQAVKQGEWKIAWPASEIDAWIAARMAARDQVAA